jgi:hypothetical protein
MPAGTLRCQNASEICLQLTAILQRVLFAFSASVERSGSVRRLHAALQDLGNSWCRCVTLLVAAVQIIDSPAFCFAG